MGIILQSLWRNKFTTIINIVCLTLGMLVAAIFISQANGAINTYNNYLKYMNLENVLIMSPLSYNEDERVQLNNIDSLEELSFVESVFAINRLEEVNLQSENNYLTGIGVYTISENFDSIFNNGYLLEGNWIRNTYDCVVGEELVKKNKLGLGDFIYIGSNRYIVSGIIGINKYRTNIFINEKSIENLVLFDCDYYVKTTSNSEEYKDLTYTFMLENYGKYEIKDNKKVMDEEKKRLYTGWAPSIFLAIIAFVYGILNIKNIEMFYLSQEKKKIAVMRAYGAQKQHILFQRIFKATVLSFISSIFVYLIVYILQFTRLNLIFDLSVDIKVYIIILIKVQIISIIFTTNMARKLLKKEIAVILRENN